MGFFSSLARGFFGENNEAKATRLAEENPFQVKLVREFLPLTDGGEVEVLSVRVRGILNSGNHSIAQENVYIGSSLFSFSPRYPEESPILCAIEDLQGVDDPFFSHVSDALTAHCGLCGGWDEWVRLVSVPLASLTFSRKGALKIKLSIRASYSLSGYITDRSVSLIYENTASGYMDSIEQRERGMEIAVYLAVLVAGIDGARDEEEAEIVTSFIRKQIASVTNPDKQNITKKRLNNAATDAHSITRWAAIRSRGYELAGEAAAFDSDIKFQIIELLLEVAGADSVATKHETDYLNDLAHHIGVDLNEYKNMRDKALPISIYEGNLSEGGNQVESMLGLNAEMSVAEKKSHLSKEFRKWNPLQNSSDPVKSKQAKDMVKAISELRQNL